MPTPEGIISTTEIWIPEQPEEEQNDLSQMQDGSESQPAEPDQTGE